MLKLEGSSIPLIYNIMPSPFPGMDPYLENPQFWPELHSRLIVAIADFLTPYVRPKYEVAIEKRIYETNEDNSLLVGIPDVIIKHQSSQPQSSSESISTSTLTRPVSVMLPVPVTVRQVYLEVREMTNKKVITAIEILSPINKKNGDGRTQYLKKRQQILGSLTHLVEVDLLRNYSPMPILNSLIDTDYRIVVSRGDQRPRGDLYAFNLTDSLPTFAIPLQSEDLEPILNLQQIFNDIYDRSGYDYRINYTQEIIPPLDEKYQAWVKNIVSGT